MPVLSSLSHTVARTPGSAIPGRLLRYLAVPLLATGLLALCAHISVPVSLSPVPTTMQTFAVLLIAFVLGPVAACSTMLLYLGEGALGLPVFSPYGIGGVAQLFGPTGGYLLSYPVAAFLAASAFRTLKRFLPLPAALLAGSFLAEAVFFTAGVTWLHSIFKLPVGTALHAGLVPFLPAECMKVTLLVLLVSMLERAKRINSFEQA